MSIERRRYLSEINTGRKRPEEEKQRISASLKGRPKPPRSKDHIHNLAEANRRNAERKKAENLLNPKPSQTMRRVLMRLSDDAGMSATDIAVRDGINIGTLVDALRRMESFGWVSIEWRKPTTTRTGRGSGRGVRRHYSLTEKGKAAVLQNAA